MDSQLDPQLLPSIRLYAETFDKKTRLRGEGYFKDGCVTGLDIQDANGPVNSVVTGNTNYLSTLTYTPKGAQKWRGSCTCPVGMDCKHCYAVALALIRTLSENADHSKGKKTAKKVKFATEIAERLGRELTELEKRSAKAVDELFDQYRDSKMIAEGLLDKITGSTSSWHWNSVELWKTPPQTPWEAWLSVAAYLRKRKQSSPASFLEATDWSEVDEMLSVREYKANLDRWQGWLRKRFNQLQPAEAVTQVFYRAKLTGDGIQLQWRKSNTASFTNVKQGNFIEILNDVNSGNIFCDDDSLLLWRVFATNGSEVSHRFGTGPANRILSQLLRKPGLEQLIVGPREQPLTRVQDPLRWAVSEQGQSVRYYHFDLVRADGSIAPPALTAIDGNPALYITEEEVFTTPPLSSLPVHEGTVKIPAAALENSFGLQLLDKVQAPVPEPIAKKVKTEKLSVVFRGHLDHDYTGRERLNMTVVAQDAEQNERAQFCEDGWLMRETIAQNSDSIVRFDTSDMEPVPQLLEALKLSWDVFALHWIRSVNKQFPEQLAAWMDTLTENHPNIQVVLGGDLAAFCENPVTAKVSLQFDEAGIDWFDLRVKLDVSDTALTEDEVQLLLDARGKFVRLGEKGWRRLKFVLSEEDEKQLAEMGLSARDFSSKPQRLHALQLAGTKAAKRLLPGELVESIEKRATEIRTRVTPEVPQGIRAELRPYQVDGFHFLSYLATNQFGGILADDMGLGKTLQTLTWLVWLRSQPGFEGTPSLVVSPKSVTDNWVTEAARFAPDMPVCAIPRGSCDEKQLAKLRKGAAVIVINYAQLRILEAIASVPWHAVILDEAQYIKNPQSQTAQAACSLRASYKIALSGTPIENKLLDLWSIMSFAMPGVLGNRSRFSKDFDQKGDPHARRRLGARVRPFVLRRTKNEVAKDLPERIEEDRLCEMEGEQAKLYSAELKRARSALLKIKTTAELDKARFNILTSLLRLRQICCHPALVRPKAENDESAKLAALLDIIEPLMEEGQKVLVFSQFVNMLEMIREELASRGWKHLILTGETEDRGALVKEFQETEESAVFLISLRAGGSGLNLTAASYVVLFDPWWNPAVENQAIDRTHRIGQKNTVIAYRLIVKESIEEKIRRLQTQKSALAEDILGEEAFARTLTLEDFQFLLQE